MKMSSCNKPDNEMTNTFFNIHECFKATLMYAAYKISTIRRSNNTTR